MNEVAETDKDKKELIKLDIQAMFKNIAFSANTKEMEKAVDEMKEYFLKEGVCKKSANRANNKKKAHNEDEDAVC